MASPSEVTPHAGNFLGSDEYIAFQLGKTQNNIKWAEIGAALLWVSIAFFAYLLFFVVFDQWVVPGGFGLVPRLVMLVALLGGIGWAVCRHILFPSLKQVHELYAARVLESADPALKSALLNYVDLQRAGKPLTPAVQRALEKRAAVTLSKYDVDQAVDRRPLLRFAYVLLALVALFGIYTVLSPKDVMTSVKRALLPSTTPVATQTQIADVTPGNVTLPARSPLVVEADIRGRIPESVQLVYTTADRNILDETVEMRQIDPALPRFRGTISSDGGRGLMQDVTYHLVAGDTRTEVYHATVIQPPSAKVDEVEYAYLPYTKLEPKKVPGGAIDAWEGSTVTVRATANVPVKSAVLILTDKEDSHAKGDEIPLVVKDGTKLEGHWTLGFRRDGTTPRFYHIRVRTEKGESDPDPTHYPLKLRPDQPPEVVLLTPTGDVQMPANATLAMSIQAADPDFGLRSLTLRAELPNGREPLGERLFEDRDLGMSFKGLHLFSLERLRLKAGDKLQVWVEAKDTRQPTANARSTPKVEITLTAPVSPKEAAEELAKQKQEQDQLARADMNEEKSENAERPEEAPPKDGKAEEQKPDDPMRDDKAPRRPPQPGDKAEPKEPEMQPEQEQPGDKDGRSDEEVLKDLLDQQQKDQAEPKNQEQHPNPPQPKPQDNAQRDPKKRGEKPQPQNGNKEPQPNSQPSSEGGEENAQNGGQTKSSTGGKQGTPTKTPQNAPKPGETKQPGQGTTGDQSANDMPSDNGTDNSPTPAGGTNAQKQDKAQRDSKTGTKSQEREPGKTTEKATEKPSPESPSPEKTDKEHGPTPEKLPSGMNDVDGTGGEKSATKPPMPAQGAEKKPAESTEKGSTGTDQTTAEKAKPAATQGETSKEKTSKEKTSKEGTKPETAKGPSPAKTDKTPAGEKPTDSPSGSDSGAGASGKKPGTKPGEEPKPNGQTGTKPGETPKPGESPMPGATPMPGDKAKDPTAGAKPNAGEKPAGEKPGAEKTGTEKPAGAEKTGAGKPGDPKTPGEVAKPAESPMNAGDKPMGEGGEKPAGAPPEKTPGKPGEKMEQPGTKPMPEKATGEKATGEKATGEKTTGEKTTGEKATGENSTAEKTKPGDMPERTKPDEAAPKNGMGADKPIPQPGGKPDDMIGGKNETGGGKKDADDPASPEKKPGGGNKGTPSDGDMPGANDQPAEPGKGTKPARKDDQAAAQGTTDGAGEEKPTEDSANARDVKATGEEKGLATGSEKTGTDNAKAKSDLQRKDDKQGVKKPGDAQDPPKDGKTEKAKAGEKPKNSKPAPGQPGGASDQAEQAKPADKRKTDPDRTDDPDAERPHDDTKNPDRPPERNGGQPDAGNDKLQGDGRKGGQKSESPMGGEAGGSKAAEKGNQGGQTKGPGDKSTEPGSTDKANGKTGEAGTEKGNGSTAKPGEAGSKPSNEKGGGAAKEEGGGAAKEKGGGAGSEKGGSSAGSSAEKNAQPDAKPGKPGEKPSVPQDKGAPQEGGAKPGQPQDSGQNSDSGGEKGGNEKGGSSSQAGKGQGAGDGAPPAGQDPANENMSRSSAPGRSGGGPTDAARENQPSDDAPVTPEENFRRNRDASNLVLNKLKDQLERGEVDQDLLKRLGWTEEKLKNFVDRMDQKINDPGEDTSPEAVAHRKRFEEFLRSLELSAKTKRKKAGDRVNRLGPNLQNDAQVPAEFRDQYEAYTKSLSQEKPAPKK